MARDDETLLKCGVRVTSTEVYLYVISHSNARVNDVGTQTDQYFYVQTEQTNLVQPFNNMAIGIENFPREMDAYHVQQQG